MGELLSGLQVKDEMLQPTINKRLLANHSHLSRTEQNISVLSEMYHTFLIQLLRLKEMLRKYG